MKKNVLFLYFLLLMSSSLFAQVDKKNYALLWEISGKDLPKPTYLFGSMHLPNARVFEFSDSVLIALDACEAFAVEVDLDSAMYITERIWNERYNYFVTEDGLDLGIHLDKKETMVAEEVDRAVEEKTETDKKNKKKKRKNKKQKNEKKSKPEFGGFDSFLRSKPTDKHTFLDAYLAYQAKKRGKAIYGLEEIEKHMDMYDAKSSDIGWRNNPVFEGIPDSLIFDKVLSFYQSGDLDKIKEFTYGMENDSVMVLRNQIMVESIERIAKKNTLFSAVGCAHLIGEKGVINLFKQKGYKVRAVTPQFTGVAENYVFKSPLKEIEWYENKNIEEGYSIQTPFKASQASQITENNDFYNCQDILTGCVYSYAVLDSKLLSIEKFSDSIARLFYAKIRTNKPFTQENITGIEYIMHNQYDTLNTLRMRVFDVNEQRFLMCITTKAPYIEADYVNRFFNSIRLSKTERKWQLFENKQGAFAINMFGMPIKKTKKIKTEIENKYYKQMHYAHTTKIQGRQANDVVIYRDLAKGELLENDTILLRMVDKYITEKLTEGEKKYTRKDTLINGYPSNNFYLNIEDKDITITSCLRGNRHYVMVHTEPTGGKDSLFMPSFRFLPFEPYNFEKQTWKEAGISLYFPKNKEEMKDNLTESSYLNTYAYKATEENTGTIFWVGVHKFSKYEYYPHIDSLYKDIEHIYIHENDTIFSKTKSILKDVSKTEVLFKNKNANTHKALQIIVNNEGVYTFLQSMPKELFHTHKIQEFFSKIEILPALSNSKIDLFTPKTSLLLEDLQSLDSTKRAQAQEALQTYKFKETDKNSIKNVLKNTLPDDTLSNDKKGMSRETLWSTLNLFFIKKITHEDIVFLKEYYMKDSLNYHKDILNTLIASKQQEAIDTFIELLDKRNYINEHHEIDLPALETAYHHNYYDVYYDITLLFDSTALLQNNYQKIVSKSDKKIFQSLLFHATHFLLKKDSTQSEMILKNLPALLHVLESNYESEQYNYFREYFVSIAYMLPKNPIVMGEIRKILQNQQVNKNIKLNVLSILLRENEDVTFSQIKDILDDKSLYADAIQTLKKYNKLAIVPKKYLKQSLFAECLMLNFVAGELGDMYMVKTLRNMVIDYQGEKVRFYLFTIIYKGDEEAGASNQIGYVGAFDKDKSIFFYKKDIKNTVFMYENEKKYDENWLKQNLEEEHTEKK